jgi:hypothetical protein
MEPYRVPLLFDRSRAPIYRVINISDEPLRGFTGLISGSGVMPALSPMLLLPRQYLDLHIRGDDLALATTVIFRWVRRNGDEYLLRVSF